jgi:hypothetical protein
MSNRSAAAKMFAGVASKGSGARDFVIAQHARARRPAARHRRCHRRAGTTRTNIGVSMKDLRTTTSRSPPQARHCARKEDAQQELSGARTRAAFQRVAQAGHTRQQTPVRDIAPRCVRRVAHATQCASLGVSKPPHRDRGCLSHRARAGTHRIVIAPAPTASYSPCDLYQRDHASDPRGCKVTTATQLGSPYASWPCGN